jgi:isopentenyldiphosphate isomerase
MYNFVKLKDHTIHRFFNKYFLREREQLLKLIKRKPEKKKRRFSDESFDSRWENDIKI